VNPNIEAYDFGSNGSAIQTLLCCLACTPNSWKSHPFHHYWLYPLAFAVDGYQLSCDPSTYGMMVPRNNDNWCSKDQDFTYEGIRSLLKCPGTAPYTGVQKQPRFVSSGGSVQVVPPTTQGPSCGSQFCNNRGSCSSTSSPVCTCDNGFWGSSCQFSKCSQLCWQ
jgi:hypothetical protein